VWGATGPRQLGRTKEGEEDVLSKLLRTKSNDPPRREEKKREKKRGADSSISLPRAFFLYRRRSRPAVGTDTKKPAIEGEL